jgi:hypothetical protein
MAALQTVHDYFQDPNSNVIDLLPRLSKPVTAELFNAVCGEEESGDMVQLNARTLIDYLQLASAIYDDRIKVRIDNTPLATVPPKNMSSKITHLEFMVRRVNSTSRFRQPLENLLERIVSEDDTNAIAELFKAFFDVYKLYQDEESELDNLFQKIVTLDQPQTLLSTASVVPAKPVVEMGSVIGGVLPNESAAPQPVSAMIPPAAPLMSPVTPLIPPVSAPPPNLISTPNQPIAPPAPPMMTGPPPPPPPPPPTLIPPQVEKALPAPPPKEKAAAANITTSEPVEMFAELNEKLKQIREREESPEKNTSDHPVLKKPKIIDRPKIAARPPAAAVAAKGRPAKPVPESAAPLLELMNKAINSRRTAVGASSSEDAANDADFDNDYTLNPDQVKNLIDRYKKITKKIGELVMEPSDKIASLSSAVAHIIKKQQIMNEDGETANRYLDDLQELIDEVLPPLPPLPTSVAVAAESPTTS